MTTRAERIAALPSLGRATTREGDERDIVGNRTCPDCGEAQNILRGKAKLYTVGCGCGMRLSNGHKLQDILLTACEPVPVVEDPAPVVQDQPESDPAPVIQDEQKRDPAPDHRRPGFLHWFMNLQVIP